MNVLVALTWPNHLGHRAARTWLTRTGAAEGWATTPITEGGFVRVSSNRSALPAATSPELAVHALKRLCSATGHEFCDVQHVIDEAS